MSKMFDTSWHKDLRLIDVEFDFDDPQITITRRNGSVESGSFQMLGDWRNSGYRERIIDEAISFHEFVNSEIAKVKETKLSFDELIGR
jgi:hypothetical protein